MVIERSISGRVTANEAFASICCEVESNQQICGKYEPDDELEGFETCTLDLPREDDGPLCATLTRTVHSEPDDRPGVIYVHGFVDYFFQRHLAEAFESAGFRFYALDLRRHGRSLRPGNRANFARAIDEFFPELDWALTRVASQQRRVAGLVAHSTGALIAAHYLGKGNHTGRVGCLIMNSPFFRFSLRGLDHAKLEIVTRAAKYFPYVVLPDRLSAVYGQTLHVSQQGEWNYDLTRKPLTGFPLYSGWFRMIQLAQEELGKLRLDLPVLCLHSAESKRPTQEVEEKDFLSDTVLNIEDIKTLAPKIAMNLTIVEIAGGMHDLVLSRKQARTRALSAMVRFVAEHSSSVRISA